MIHDSRCALVHEILHKVMLDLDLLPNDRLVPFVSDRESGILKSIACILTGVCYSIVCWNHLRYGFKYFLKKHGVNSELELNVYDNNLLKILRCERAEWYDACVDIEVHKWSKIAVDYFHHNLYEIIKAHSVSFIIRKFGFDSDKGITTNRCESLNHVFKQLNMWNPIRMDNMILCFYELQTYYVAEICRAFVNTGKWYLKLEFAQLKVSPLDMPSNVCDPEIIVDIIRGKVVANTVKNEILDIDESNLGKARLAVYTNRVQLNDKLHSFIVIDSKGSQFMITLNPERCSCSFRFSCWHILACKLLVGLPTNSSAAKKRRVSLKMLKQTVRKKGEKKSGTKKIKLYDIDVDAAPDSKAAKSFAIPLVTSLNIPVSVPTQNLLSVITTSQNDFLASSIQNLPCSISINQNQQSLERMLSTNVCKRPPLRLISNLIPAVSKPTIVKSIFYHYGLPNVSSNCWFNAAIQCLMSLQSVRELLPIVNHHMKTLCPETLPFYDFMCCLMRPEIEEKILFDCHLRCLNFIKVKFPQFVSGQQCASEFFTDFLLPWFSNFVEASGLFNFVMNETMVCDCGHSHRIQSVEYTCMHISVPRFSVMTLSDLLIDTCTSRPPDVKCPMCGLSPTVQHNLSTLPTCLLLFLKRTHFVNRAHKNRTAVKIDCRLVVHENTFFLKSAIVHLGPDANQGHYIAYNGFQNDDCLKIDDLCFLPQLTSAVLDTIKHECVALLYEIIPT